MSTTISKFYEKNSRLNFIKQTKDKSDYNKQFIENFKNQDKYYNLSNTNPYKNQINFQGNLNGILCHNLKSKFSKIISKFSKVLPISFEKYISEIAENSKGLSIKKIEHLRSKLSKMEHSNKNNETKILKLGMILKYDEMRKAGKTAEEIRTYLKEDTETIKRAQRYYEDHIQLQKHMFGYPANMEKDSSVTQYLRKKEANLYLMNNCGDPYEAGNYQMDNKQFEKDILNLFYKKFGLEPGRGWGYITSGGSESNKWGIYNGFKKHPKGRLYFCESAHYSVEKSVSNGNKAFYPYTIIDQESEVFERIDKTKLFSEIKKNWENKKEPAVVFLTWGTTKAGSGDNVKEISEWLNENNIPHYIHLDAALYGGIPTNQKAAPVISSLDDLGVDTISVSFHKYIGNADVNSILVAKEKGLGKHINYIGQTDNTTAGSRSFRPFSTLQRIKERLERSIPEDYKRNINSFEQMLKDNDVRFARDELSNIFIIEKPSENLCKYYQLSTFTDKDGKDLAHIIIFPYHENDSMSELARAIANDYKK